MTVKISELPVATEFESGDVIPIVQDGSTKQLDANGNWTFGAIDGTPIGGSTPSTGAFTSVDIDGGNIDGTAIGVSSASAGAFTTLTASDDVNFDSGTLFVDVSENKVGINTTSPALALHVNSGNTNGGILMESEDSGAYISFLDDTTTDKNSVLCGAIGNNFLFYTSAQERMRIDSSGNVLIGTTSTADTSSGLRIVSTTMRQSASGTENVDFHDFYRGTEGSLTRVGNIRTTGSGTTYNTSSDYRLKENAQPITGALAKVQAMNPVRYNWKADGSEGEGFIAHELQEVVPYAVSGEKDGEQMQGVDYGKLTTLLTAAIKELTAKVESLEAQLEVK